MLAKAWLKFHLGVDKHYFYNQVYVSPIDSTSTVAPNRLHSRRPPQLTEETQHHEPTHFDPNYERSSELHAVVVMQKYWRRAIAYRKFHKGKVEVGPMHTVCPHQLALVVDSTASVLARTC